MIELAIFLVVLAGVARWVTAPLRNPARAAGRARPDATLAAERDARLAAVRDAELDLRTGKLTAAEHAELDARLRAEALEAMGRADEAAR